LSRFACEGNGDENEDEKESFNVFGLGKTRCVSLDVVSGGSGDNDDGFSLSEGSSALKDVVEKVCFR
jgi:hypothetical protein